MQANLHAFSQWAVPKLRPLLEARLKDSRLQLQNSPHFHRLLDFYMAEIQEQPFAQPRDFDRNNSRGCAVILAPRALRQVRHLACGIVLVDVLVQIQSLRPRQRAAAFFQDHSNPEHHPLINAYESAGNVFEDSPLDGCTALELWASTEPTLVRELTCLELGIPATTSIALLPNNFCVRRKFVIKREFAALSAAEQDDWHALARERKRASARGETDFIAVQEAQTLVPAWLSHTILEKLSQQALGEMVIQWDGFFVGLHDNAVVCFHGQAATYNPYSLWHDSPSYVALVEPAWRSYVSNEVGGTLIDKLRELPPDAGPELLSSYRQAMGVFLEDLFRLACRLPHLNRAAFWELVSARPDEFVASHRLPEGVAFCNPVHMKEKDFRAFYAHVSSSFDGSDTIDRASRFAYETDTVNLYIGLSDAQHLKARWDARRLEATNAAAVVGTSTDDPDLVVVDTFSQSPRRCTSDQVTNDAAVDDTAHAVQSPGNDGAPINEPALVNLVPLSHGGVGSVAMYRMSDGGEQ